MSKRKTIKVSTDLLEAVAKWAHVDSTRAIGVVAFRKGEMIATDGHRLVRVPVETHGLEFGVIRADIIGAVAAQAAIARDDIEPKVDHDTFTTIEGATGLTDGPHGGREIDIYLDGESVILDLGAVTLRALKADISLYPDVDTATPRDVEPSPDGYVFQPRYLAAIDEVNTASGARGGGVRVVAWSRAVDGDRIGPAMFENSLGVRFVLMPMKPWTDDAS